MLGSRGRAFAATWPIVLFLVSLPREAPCRPTNRQVLQAAGGHCRPDPLIGRPPQSGVGESRPAKFISPSGGER